MVYITMLNNDPDNLFHLKPSLNVPSGSVARTYSISTFTKEINIYHRLKKHIHVGTVYTVPCVYI